MHKSIVVASHGCDVWAIFIDFVPAIPETFAFVFQWLICLFLIVNGRGEYVFDVEALQAIGLEVVAYKVGELVEALPYVVDGVAGYLVHFLVIPYLGVQSL